MLFRDRKFRGFVFYFPYEIKDEFSPESEGSRCLKRVAKTGNNYSGEWEIARALRKLLVRLL